MGHSVVLGSHELALAALQGYPLLRLSTAGPFNVLVCYCVFPVCAGGRVPRSDPARPAPAIACKQCQGEKKTDYFRREANYESRVC